MAFRPKKPPVRRMSTGLTREEIKELKEIFQMFDADDSGTIDTSELGGIMKMLGKNLKEKELKRMIKKVDTDGNGTVEFPEFVQYICTHSPPVDEDEELREAFKVFDKNGDGLITAGEIKQVLRSMGENMTDEEIHRMIESVGGSGNGDINYEDFVALANKKKGDEEDKDT